jgi:hypothetical protein
MKPLIIPIAIGLLAGLGGGSGYAYMKASQQHAVDVARADSIKAHADSTHADSAHADSAHADGASHDTPADSTAADSTGHAAALPMTPADSIRALEEARKAVKGGGHDAEPVTTKLADVKPAETKAAAKGDAKGDAKPAGASTTTTAVAVKDARDAALQTSLPEQRLAKIFGAMSPKDAAKVLDQMSDSDVRAILALMGDRQAASILSAFPASRAASITRGAIKVPENKP